MYAILLPLLSPIILRFQSGFSTVVGSPGCYGGRRACSLTPFLMVDYPFILLSAESQQ